MTEQSKCTGCAACKLVCPYNCIEMKYDREGFLQPRIDENKCKNCGKCKKVCPVENEMHLTEMNKTDYGYVGYATDDKIRMSSSSGGVFTLLAQYVLERGGFVYGAGYDRAYMVRHFEISSVEDLKSLRGSKYVQSNVGNIYRKIKQRLEEGKTVLFSGTGCQIAGLKKFLNKEYDNLYSVAIICHGVPSPGIWSQYKKKYYGLKGVNFRDKTHGWRSLHLKIEDDKGTKLISKDKDPFFHAFLHNLILRKSCYNCKFRAEKSHADVMIGDAWGIEFYARSMDDNKGSSMMLAYTKKGLNIIQNILPHMVYKEVNSAVLYRHNRRIQTSVSNNKDRQIFFKVVRYIPIELALKIFRVKEIFGKRKNI